MQELRKNPIIARLTTRTITWLDGSKQFSINTIPSGTEENFDVLVRQAAIVRRFTK